MSRRRRRESSEQPDAPDNGPRLRAVAFSSQPGRLGTVVHYLDLPAEVVERYAVRKEPPQLKAEVAAAVVDYVGRL